MRMIKNDKDEDQDDDYEIYRMKVTGSSHWKRYRNRQKVTKFLSPQKINVVDTFKNFDGSEEEKNAMLGYITRAKMTAKAFSSLWGYFIVSWNEAVGMQPFKALTNTVWGSGEQKKAEKEKNSIDVVKDGTETIAIVFPSQDLVWYT